MKRYTGWQRFWNRPAEPELELTNDEVLWWDNEKSYRTHGASLAQAIVIVAIGLTIGGLMAATVQWAMGNGFLFQINSTMLWVNGTIATLGGWHTFSKTKHQNMLKTKRLRDAMQLEQEDLEERPRRLLQ